MKDVKEILEKKSFTNGSYVNSNYRDFSTVNSRTVGDEITAFLEEKQITPEGVAMTLAERLDDKRSLEFYLILARENSCALLLEIMSITLDADSRGKIKLNKPVYFIGICRKKGIQTKFRK